jgi:hypothetical protein
VTTARDGSHGNFRMRSILIESATKSAAEAPTCAMKKSCQAAKASALRLRRRYCGISARL